MPSQTTLTGGIVFPDGARVLVKSALDASYVDIGAIGSDITLTLNYTEEQYTTSNAGKLQKRIREMLMDGGFTLINLETDNINRLGGGLFTIVDQAGTAITAFDNQTIAGFTAGSPVDLSPIVTATKDAIKFSAAPVLTSVTASVSGVLAAGDDYIIVKDPNAVSGYSILFNPAGAATVDPTESIVIVFGSNAPIAGTNMYAGTSSTTLDAFSIKFSHYNSAGAVDRECEIFSANPTSGGFQFNFKGANSDGVEEMPITFQGVADTSLDDGKQLFRYFIAA